MIRIRGLLKSYRGTPVLRDVNADLAEGAITFLMGKNGAGKTTLLKAMLGLEACTGDILYDGRRLPSVYGKIGVVYDDAPMYRRLTGLQNVRVLCARRIDAARIPRLTGSLLAETELGRRAGTYSYGQRKKLAIAIALLGEPEYLMMDEVSNGLDYETMQWLKQELRERSSRTTILLTGHQFDFYDSIVDRVLVLKDHRINEMTLPQAHRPQSGLGVVYEAVLKDAQR